jgi:transposase
MANVLKMATIESILALRAQRWSFRRISISLGVHRDTVARYVHLAESKPAKAPPGSITSNSAKAPAGAADAPVAPPPTSRSQCEPWREEILAKLSQGLSAERIRQDLSADPAFTASYYSVRRFVSRLSGSTPLPFRRMESAPGDESQADFGKGAPVITAEGKRKKTHLFRITLSHSRKGYSEATYRQTTDDFLRVLENAFWHFGGVPKVLTIDNLKAAVKHADWYDPELVPKVAAFARHYGVVILPTKPRMPRHKGKIERGIDYGQENGLKGHTFTSIEAQNDHLLHWETNVADTRIHGTTRRQVGKAFREVEQPALQPLPRERFVSFHEAQRIVNRDGHIEVAKAYYSVPPEYVGLKVWARWDARTVRVFTQRMEPITLHARHEQGRFSTHGAHIAREKISGLEQGAWALLNKVKRIGPRSHAWAQAMVTARGIEGTRLLMGLIALTKRHDSQELEKACEIALSHGAYQLRTIRQLLKRQEPKQESLPFLEEHPLIRPLEDYARVVAAAHERGAGRRDRGDGLGRHRSGVRVGMQQASPDGLNHQGSGASSTRPRSDYPSSGCSAAEPDSVSPDASSVIRVLFSSQ